MKLVVAAALTFAMIVPASAQVASGRSNSGSLIPVYSGQTGPKVKGLTFEMEFSEPSGNKFLDAKETGRLRLLIGNPGRMTVRNVVARVRPLAEVKEVTYNDSISVGDVPVGTTRYAIFYFGASENVNSQILTFSVELYNPEGVAADPQLLTFLTRRSGGADGRVAE